MKALVYEGPYQLSLQNIPDPVPGPHEVVVRIKSVGICGSDVHGYTGTTGRRLPPLVMGHEASGIVEAVGSEVALIETGAPVCFDSTVFCRQCAACGAGQFHLCANREVLGVSVPGMKRQGAMAELVALPWWTLHLIPDSITFTDAALLEPVSIALHAVRRGYLHQGESVVVIGAGTIGLLILQVCLMVGASAVTVVDINPDRLRIAAEMGAHHTATKVPEDTSADLSFEAVGIGSTLRAAVGALCRGGRTVLVGNLTPEVSIDVQGIVAQEWSLIGTYASGGAFADALHLVSTGAVNPRPLVSEILPLSAGAEAFRRLHGGQEALLKVVLEP